MYYYRGQVSLAFCQSRKGNPCRELMTRPWLSDWSQASAVVVNAVALRGAATSAPLVVGLDGRSGSGKPTLACLVAEKTDAVVLSADDFYSAHISDVEWDLMSVEERWSKVFNWAKLRSEAGEQQVPGSKSPGRGFPQSMVPSARDGVGDGIVCEK